MSFLNDNEDLLYYLDRGIDWATLASLSELGFRQPDGFGNTAEALDFYREIARVAGEFAANEIAPHTAEIDREGVRFSNGSVSFPARLESVCQKMAELGLHAMALPRELGGTNTPLLVYFIVGELLARADVSVMTHYGFHGGPAMAMLIFSLLEGSTDVDPTTGRIRATRWHREIAEIASGAAWGSMDITEPDAGSDMAALKAVGERDADGQWTVTGQKVFITSGHGKYHFVVARTEKATDPDDKKAGLGGLSMFLVPAFRDEADGSRTQLVSFDRVEEKLGHHGSATVALTFERSPADLVGKPGDGFKQMLEMMNHARLSVGFESIGLAECALRLARAYAAERRSMGKTLDHHEMIADYLEEAEVDILGLRALAMHAAFHEEVGHKIELFGRFVPGWAEKGSEELRRDARRHRLIARRATPLLKYLAGEKAVEIARRALQIHGGNGYMREYGAEKLLRDALVMPIYEGTSQIQALMAMKDTLNGIIRRPERFIKRVAQTRFRALSARDSLERRVARLSQLALAAEQHLITATVSAKVKSAKDKPIGEWRQALLEAWNPKRDFTWALLHAERLTRLLADELICEVLYAQGKRDPERRSILERYLDRAEPRARFLHDEITTTGRRVIQKLATEAEDPTLARTG